MDKKDDAARSETRVESNWPGMAKRPALDRWLALTEMGREPIKKHTDALHRLILETTGRKKELANSQWDEFDFVEAVWTMPASRSKNGRVRKIPLSSASLKILRSLKVDANPADPRVFAPLGKWLYEEPAFHQSMSRLGFTYRNVAELRKEAVRRMENRLVKMSKADVDAFNGGTLTRRALVEAMTPGPSTPELIPR